MAKPKKSARRPRPPRVVEFGYYATRTATPSGIPLGTYSTASATPPKGPVRKDYKRVAPAPEPKRFGSGSRTTQLRSLAGSVDEFDRLTSK